MPRLRSGADIASPPPKGTAAAAAPPPTPPAEMAGAPSGTPGPSPSTMLSLGLGPAAAAADGSPKSPTVAAPPRRSLRLAGGASPATPSSAPPGADGASSGSGSGSSGKKRRGRARAVSAPVAAAPTTNGGELGGGGEEVRVSGGSGGDRSGEGAFIGLRSRSRIAKRSMESGVDLSGEMGVGSGGGDGAGGKVHDEMPHGNADSLGKRHKGILTGEMKMEYVPDADGDGDDACVLLGEGSRRMPVHLCTAPNVVEPNVFTMRMGRADEGRRGDSVNTVKEENKGVSILENDISFDEHLHRQNSADASIGEIIEPLASPVRNPALVENAMEEERMNRARYDAKADEDEHSDGDDDDEEEVEPTAEPQDWPGPYLTAMSIIIDREAKLRDRESNSSNLNKSVDKVILWTPSKDRKSQLRSAPSLTSLCLQTLLNNSEAIESLAGIPDELKNRLLTSLCHSRKMNGHLLSEIVCDNPVTVQLSECSWLSEDDFETIFGKCRTEFLQLDLSGRCMPDYLLPATLAKTIGRNCPQLSSLDLRNLNRLRDSAMSHLRNGCRLIKKLKLQRNAFSDEAVSYFLEQSGGYLTELCLSNVEKAANLTAHAIVRNCSTHLEVLDLSFCRELSNEALGLIVDSCSSLRILKLFGCTQITDVFLKGHSNSVVTVIGIEGNILEQTGSPNFSIAPAVALISY
uniref:Uncharacterized protein n=1 Tax=Leersia perrieri TaxID=77586 RepID=A0A0D9X8M1_9ORYZ